MEQRLYEALQRNPIIAAVRDDEGLAQCLRTDIQTVFVLYGDICNISEIVRQIKDAGKIAIVHADLISGLAAKEISVDFLRRSTQADGVISTRANMIQRAKELNMIAILRVFLIDSMALDSALSAKNLKPDAIDILPGLMPSMLRKVRQLTGLPILTGGLITEKKEVMQALEAGALAAPADVYHHAHLGQQQDEAGAAGGEEGQRDAGVGQGVGDDRDVAEHLPRDLRHDADAH